MSPRTVRTAHRSILKTYPALIWDRVIRRHHNHTPMRGHYRSQLGVSANETPTEFFPREYRAGVLFWTAIHGIFFAVFAFGLLDGAELLADLPSARVDRDTRCTAGVGAWPRDGPPPGPPRAGVRAGMGRDRPGRRRLPAFPAHSEVVVGSTFVAYLQDLSLDGWVDRGYMRPW